MTDAQARLLVWAERHAHHRTDYTGKLYSPFVCHIMNLFDERVHRGDHCCAWVSPYGFVPEAGCPEHD